MMAIFDAYLMEKWETSKLFKEMFEIMSIELLFVNIIFLYHSRFMCLLQMTICLVEVKALYVLVQSKPENILLHVSFHLLFLWAKQVKNLRPYFYIVNSYCHHKFACDIQPLSTTHQFHNLVILTQIWQCQCCCFPQLRSARLCERRIVWRIFTRHRLELLLFRLVFQGLNFPRQK